MDFGIVAASQCTHAIYAAVETWGAALNVGVGTTDVVTAGSSTLRRSLPDRRHLHERPHDFVMTSWSFVPVVESLNSMHARAPMPAQAPTSRRARR